MSNLRIIGLIIGFIGLFLTFIKYRGAKWNRGNFLIFLCINLFLIVVSVYPNSINEIRDMLFLHEAQYGRLLVLLIFSVFFLLFISFYTRTKVAEISIHIDKLVRKIGINTLEEDIAVGRFVKPIMVLIPAYNEAENLRVLLKSMPGQINGTEVGVIVIDDGSDDDTVDIVRKFNYMVVSNIINRGQGSASRLGYDLLIKYNVSIGVTMDADNQHIPGDIETLIKPILDGQCDLVIGSRIFGEQEKGSPLRRIGIILFSKTISFLLGLRITDCSSGFKAFNVARLNNIHLTENQFQSAEVIIEAAKKGLRIGEVPITVNHRKYGHSKKYMDWAYGLHFSRVIIKTWWR